jgi:hypothetical protein
MILIALTAISTPGRSWSTPLRCETKDRLTSEQRSEMVEAPMRYVQAGDLPRAGAVFEKLLQDTAGRAGPQSVEVADLLSAYGVGLFAADHTVEALSYLHRAIDAYRARFGETDPETALALADYAQATEAAYPGELRPDVLAAFEEAYQIRLATLGPNDDETAMSAVDLVRAEADPRRIQGDGAKIDGLATVLRSALAGILVAPNWRAGDEFLVRRTLADLLLQNGRAAEGGAEEAAISQIPDDASLRVAKVAQAVDKRSPKTDGKVTMTPAELAQFMADVDTQSQPVCGPRPKADTARPK